MPDGQKYEDWLKSKDGGEDQENAGSQPFMLPSPKRGSVRGMGEAGAGEEAGGGIFKVSPSLRFPLY
jgi:hypothetical protein